MTTLHADQRIESNELLGEFGPWAIEIDPRPQAVLYWTEGIAWHATVRGLACLTDEEGEPVATVAGNLESELRRLLGDDNGEYADVYVQVSDQDEPALEVSVGLKVEPFTMDRLGEVAWPVVATLTNVFDPGTFGVEYVMGNVADLVEAETATCQHCGRMIAYDKRNGWFDPEATGDDSIWRFSCDRHDTFDAVHEPGEYVDPGLEDDLRLIRKHDGS